MNNNSSKQILLSVIGVAILVVAVVGVSFAFFTYTRTGSQNNTITTGSIVFNFTDGSDTINLVDHFPISTAEGLALTGTNNVCTFTVTGKTVTGSSIAYKVWAVPGDAITGKTRFQDSEIYVNLQAVPGANSTFTPAMTSTTASAISALTKDTVDTTRGLLGTGTITGTGESISTSFTARMWVSADEVVIGEDQTYTSDEYANLYYTMKIVVTAEA